MSRLFNRPSFQRLRHKRGMAPGPTARGTLASNVARLMLAYAFAVYAVLTVWAAVAPSHLTDTAANPALAYLCVTAPGTGGAAPAQGSHSPLACAGLACCPASLTGLAGTSAAPPGIDVESHVAGVLPLPQQGADAAQPERDAAQARAPPLTA